MRESQLLADVIRGLYGAVKLMRANVGMVRTEDGRRFSSGLPKGFPDLFGFLPPELSRTGHVVPVFIECKVGANKPTPEQVDFLARHRVMGCACGVARSVSDAWDIVIPYLAERPDITQGGGEIGKT